jgi:superfamily I DNA/RNA helicase
MRPTAEQQAVIDTVTTAIREGRKAALIVTAAAGSGKTSTLHATSQAIRDEFGPRVRVLVTAFNKDVISDGVKRFGDLATCKTTHSLAYRTHGHLYRARMNDNPTDTARGLAAKLGFKGTVLLRHLATDVEVTTKDAARLVRQTVDNYCSSADFDITEEHIPFTLKRDHPLHDQFVTTILDAACAMWEELQDPDGRKFRFSHDMYRKLWALTQPQLPFEVIMLDEAQDTPPVVEAVFRDQDALRVAVGDSSQSLYEFTGAVDALRKLRDNDAAAVERSLLQSFRFGQKIADLANRWLSLPVMQTGMQVIGNPAVDSTIVELMPITQADAVLCRTNAGALAVVIESVNAGRKTALVGNIKALQSLMFGLSALSKGQRPRHPDLVAFETWDDLAQAVKDEDASSDLAIAFQLADRYTAKVVLDVIPQLVAESDADLVVSTAHKSKGRQWSRVRIHDDFARKVDKRGNPLPVTRQWGNLAYVAVTRAQHVLDAGPLIDGGE